MPSVEHANWVINCSRRTCDTERSFVGLLSCIIFFQLQIWVYGNSFESYLVAVINPVKQAVEEWAEQAGVSGDFESLCENAEVKKFFIGELARIGKEKKVFSSSSGFDIYP